jgi:hypothetical protein
MTRLRQRKTQLSFITNATARYRGKDREIVITALPDTAIIRLLGTRVQYEVSWRGVHDLGARIAASKKPVGKRGAA